MARKLRAKKWDSAAHLETEADIARYWEACLVEGRDDPSFITTALGNIARARGMSQLARKTGLTREGLYKPLSPGGNPEFGTVMKVIRALGLELRARPRRGERAAAAEPSAAVALVGIGIFALGACSGRDGSRRCTSS